jgi:glycosyltransferase involved in cell wall biosynthesis
MFSNDPEICVSHADLPPGHPRRRHREYAAELCRQAGGINRLAILVSVAASKNFQPEHEKNGLSIIPVASPHRILAPVSMILPALKAIRNFKPDLITAQSPWEAGPIAVLAARLSKASLLLQIHGDIGTREWNQQSFSYHLRTAVARVVCRSADKIRVVSESMKTRLADAWRIPIEKFVVVPVPVSMPEPTKLSRKEAKNALMPGLANHPTVLFVGRLYAPKNIELWVETAAAIAERSPEARFIIVGDGDEKQKLLTLLEKHQLYEKTILTGHVSRDKLPDIYKCGDVFLLTSSHEAFGMVVVESLLARTPVVSTATGGPSEILRDRITGRLIASGKSEDLAVATVELLHDEKTRQKMGDNGRISMQQRYSPEIVTEKLIEAWLRTIDRNCKPPAFA